MLDGDSGVLCVRRKLCRGTGSAAQVFEDLEVARPRVYDARSRSGDQLVDEGKYLVLGRRAPKDPRIGDDPDQAGNGEG